MQERRRWRRVILVGILLLVVFWGLTNVSMIQQLTNRFLNVASPFLYGLAMAFIINLPMGYIEKKLTQWTGKKSIWFRILSLVISLVLIVLFIAFLIFLVLPDLQDTVNYFISALPGQINYIINRGQDFIDNHPQLIDWVSARDIDWNALSNELIIRVRSFLTSLAASIVNMIPTIINSIFTLVIAFIFAIYLLFDKEKLVRQFKKIIYTLFHIKIANFIVNVGEFSYITVRGFLYGQTMAGIITGIALFILMKIFQFPYALSISVVTGITTLIPFYGAIFGGLLGFLLISVYSFSQGIWFLILIVIVQQVEGNILYPNLVGTSIGIPGIWVMVVVTIAGAFYGLWGMFLSVPIFSVIYNIIAQNVNYRLDNRDLEINTNTKNVNRSYKYKWWIKNKRPFTGRFSF